MNVNTSNKFNNRTVAAVIAAFTFAGVVAAAPSATAVTWIPEPVTTSASTFDIGLWVAEGKARMARDWANRARNEAAAVDAEAQDMGEMVAQAKARAAHG